MRWYDNNAKKYYDDILENAHSIECDSNLLNTPNNPNNITNCGTYKIVQYNQELRHKLNELRMYKLKHLDEIYI